MGLGGFDDILDDMFLPGSTKTEQNVGKFAPKPGGKFKKPLGKKAKPSNAPVEVNLGQVLSGDGPDTVSNTTMKPTFSLNDAASTTILPEHGLVEVPTHASREPLVLAESSHVSVKNKEVSAGFESFELEADPLCHSSTVTRKCDVYQSGPQCSETETSLHHDSDMMEQDMDLMAMSGLPRDLNVKQRDKLQPKSALSLKGPKNKSVSFSLPVETEKSPSRKQGLDSLDLNMPFEPVEDNHSNREDSPINITNEHAEFPDNDEEFESIDEILDIDSWDEPSIPTKLENDGADKRSGGSSKRNSTWRTFENDNHINGDSGDMGDMNESKDDDNWTTNDPNDTEKTTKKKMKSSKKSDFKKVKEPKKRIPHGTRRKRKQVDKALLEKLENGIDLTRLPIRDLIFVAGAKERILNKEAAISVPNSNNDSHADHDNPLDEGFDPDSEEAHRHWLKHAKKINYQTHMKISRSRRWSKEDTELFYEAIREFKTNFGMMVWLFPGRTSRQIKAKFKAEERKHPLELHDALDFRSEDLTLFGKVIQIMKEQKMAEDAAANETEEEIGQHEKADNAGTKSNHKADNFDNTDPWNDGDYDFTESADWELEADASLTQNREEKVDSEKEKLAADKCGDEVDNPEKKDLWDDDFESLEFNECADLELETDAASTRFDEKIDGQ